MIAQGWIRETRHDNAPYRHVLYPRNLLTWRQPHLPVEEAAVSPRAYTGMYRQRNGTYVYTDLLNGSVALVVAWTIGGLLVME